MFYKNEMEGIILKVCQWVSRERVLKSKREGHTSETEARVSVDEVFIRRRWEVGRGQA